MAITSLEFSLYHIHCCIALCLYPAGTTMTVYPCNRTMLLKIEAVLYKI